MRILPFLVLLSALAIAGCAAFFSIVGLKLLFVGGGLSIIIMGAALEVGKLITATFLKQRWDKISFLLKLYLISATLVLVGITSVGIYGYLSNGYNTTSVAVQGYERIIDSNTIKISELEKEIASLKSDKYNETEIASINENRKVFIEQRLQLINQKNTQIEKIRSSVSEDKSAASDISAAKQALELSKQALDSDTSRELEQIKLYNSRLEILDKEVQKWIDTGRDSIFRKSGLDKARDVKASQKTERDDIDVQIKRSQDRIEKLRAAYDIQVKEYNDRIASIELRGKSQRSNTDDSVKSIQKEISETMASIDAYNKETDTKISDLNKYKDELTDRNKKKIEENINTIKSLHIENDANREKIVHTDVGTFKFLAKSLNIELDSAVNYFIWTIMFVFDPLAVCLILAYNSLIQNKEEKTKEKSKRLDVDDTTSQPTTKLSLNNSDDILNEPSPLQITSSTIEEKVVPEQITTQSAGEQTTSEPVSEIPKETIKFVAPTPPRSPIAPHGIVSGKNHPHDNS